MILVLGRAKARGDTLERMRELGAAHVARSRLEPGCVGHAMALDAEDGLTLVFTEEWTDMDALSAHFAVPDSRTFAAALNPLAAEPPTMAIYDASLLRRM